LKSGTFGKAWDVRAGSEVGLSDVLKARFGYIYRNGDEDVNTEANENFANTATVGLGLHPPGSSWKFDAGYALDWGGVTYGTPVDPRTKADQLSMQVRWDF
jgi:hypothetical protein